MKKIKLLTLIVLFFFHFNLIGQITFESGYFINNEGEKINCLIKNMDWKNNPTNFFYKLNENGEIKEENIETVKEFGVIGFSKYIKAKVKLDISEEETTLLTAEREPIFKDEILLLKVLIDGNVKLFEYEAGSLTRFFYSVDDSEIKALVYKKYLKNFDLIVENNYFKQQLYLDLKCPEITLKDAEKLNYNKKSLTNLFKKYYDCKDTSFINLEPNNKKNFFNLSVKPAVNLSLLSIKSPYIELWNTKFEPKVTPKVGLEFEFVLPFNKRKWAIFLEPTYQYFKSEYTKDAPSQYGGKFITNIDYKSIELPIGIQHSFYFNKASKIFIKAAYVFDFNLKTKLVQTRADGGLLNSFNINTSGNFGIGLGYKFKNRYSIEMKYQTPREILRDYFAWESKYQTFSFSFGYSFFK